MEKGRTNGNKLASRENTLSENNFSEYATTKKQQKHTHSYTCDEDDHSPNISQFMQRAERGIYLLYAKRLMKMHLYFTCKCMRLLTNN